MQWDIIFQRRAAGKSKDIDDLIPLEIDSALREPATGPSEAERQTNMHKADGSDSNEKLDLSADSPSKQQKRHAGSIGEL
jgi:hypothetical protein